MSEELRLNLGAAFTRYKGFTNIDLRETVHVLPENRMDFRKLTKYSDESVSEIVSCHSFEHIPYFECEGVLREWFRVLKPGAKCHIVLPDFKLFAEEYFAGRFTHHQLMINLFAEIDGFFNQPQDWHRSCWDFKSILALAKKVGFKTVRSVPFSEKNFFAVNEGEWVHLSHCTGSDTHFELTK